MRIKPKLSDVRVLFKTEQPVLTYVATRRTSLVVESILGLLIIVIPLSVHAGVFSLFSDKAESFNEVPEVVKTDLVLDTPVLVAAQNPDPSSRRGGAEIIAQDGVLLATGPIGEDVVTNNNGEISVYSVREGDSLSLIAEMFGVTANTILWANDLANAKSIKPGQTLIILPVAGVRHVVKTGDTIASIAKKYEGDVEEIISYNQLINDQAITVGDTLVIPGGAIHTATPKKPASGSNTASTGNKKGSSFMHPAPGSIKTQGIHGYNAVDLAGSVGATIRAAAAGEVIVSKGSGWNGGYGQYIVIKHANGTQTLYAHLSANSVSSGAYVEAGQVIGAMGNSGRSTGPHLHFEVRGAKNPF